MKTDKMICVDPETHKRLNILKDSFREEGIRTIGGVVDSLVKKAYESEVSRATEGK